MHRKANSRGVRVFVAAAFAIGLPAAAMANRGGGDSGDSSMNPFTGDSYAYFHGGHNLGEQGTIFPDHAYRTPPGKAQEPKGVRKPASGPQADARVGRTPRNDLPQSPASQ